jgi:hypothetical protein
MDLLYNIGEDGNKGIEVFTQNENPLRRVATRG